MGLYAAEHYILQASIWVYGENYNSLNRNPVLNVAENPMLKSFWEKAE